MRINHFQKDGINWLRTASQVTRRRNTSWCFSVEPLLFRGTRGWSENLTRQASTLALRHAQLLKETYFWEKSLWTAQGYTCSAAPLGFDLVNLLLQSPWCLGLQTWTARHPSEMLSNFCFYEIFLPSIIHMSDAGLANPASMSHSFMLVRQARISSEANCPPLPSIDLPPCHWQNFLRYKETS